MQFSLPISFNPPIVHNASIDQKRKSVMSVFDGPTKKLKTIKPLPHKVSASCSFISLRTSVEAAVPVEVSVSDERSFVVMTKEGFISRIPVDNVKCQSRGTKGKKWLKLKSGDTVSSILLCNSKDTLIFISDRGNIFFQNVFKFPKTPRFVEGSQLNFPATSVDERITHVIATESLSELEYLVLITAKGLIKRVPLHELVSKSKKSTSCIKAITLEGSDELAGVSKGRLIDHVIISTKLGYAIRFSVEEVGKSSIESKGRIGIQLHEGDTVTNLGIYSYIPESSPLLVAITRKGYGKLIQSDELKIKKRGCAGNCSMKFKNKEMKSGSCGDCVCGIQLCNYSDEIFLCSYGGIITRQLVKELTVQSRSASGALMFKVSSSDSVACIALGPGSVSNQVVGIEAPSP